MKSILLITLLLITSCEIGPMTGVVITELSDSRFNGQFSRLYRWQDEDGYEEKYEYNWYKFDGTNKVSYSSERYSYSSYSGWSYSGDYIGDTYTADYECKIEGNYIYFKLWDNSFDEYEEGIKFSFEDNNTLVFYDKSVYEIDLVLTK